MSDSNQVNEMLDVISQVLIKCFIMGICVLLFWWGALVIMGDLAYSIHSWMIPITRPQFDVIQYSGMLVTKAMIFTLLFFPYVAIRLVIKKRIK